MYQKEGAVLLLKGRYAGCKGVVVREMFKNNGRDTVTVLGMERVPKPITEDMTAQQKKRRGKLVCFVKNINVRHLMPTAYSSDSKFENFNLRDITVVSDKVEMKKNAEKIFRELYEKNPVHWLFKKQKI